MADISIIQKSGRRKTTAPRIDLTPLVDLGFLLITFFMYTTALAKQRSLDLTMPDSRQTNNQTAFIAESTLTLLLADKHMIYYYNGILEYPAQIHKCSSTEIRNVIIKKKKEVENLSASFSKEAHKLHVIIKPHNSCQYDALVKVLDEMIISDVPYYTLVDIPKNESEMIEKR